MRRNRSPNDASITSAEGSLPALAKEQPPSGVARRLGVHSGREHWGEGTPEISMASEYNTRVSRRFRQAGNNVALSRALPSVGTLRRGAERASACPALVFMRPLPSRCIAIGPTVRDRGIPDRLPLAGKPSAKMRETGYAALLGFLG
jgi:hypothetical protein